MGLAFPRGPLFIYLIPLFCGEDGLLAAEKLIDKEETESKKFKSDEHDGGSRYNWSNERNETHYNEYPPNGFLDPGAREGKCFCSFVHICWSIFSLTCVDPFSYKAR